MKIENIIKNYRLENNLTQADLAKKIGVSAAAVGHWERGSNLPNSKYLRRMSNVMNIDVQELINASQASSGKINKMVWTPSKYSDVYYFVDPDGSVKSDNAFSPSIIKSDLLLLLMHNYFPTKEMAEKHREEMLHKYKIVLDLGLSEEALY